MSLLLGRMPSLSASSSQESPIPSLSVSSWPELGSPTQLSWTHLAAEQSRVTSDQPSESASTPQWVPGPAKPLSH